VLEFGSFRFLDVGDLSAQPLFDLVCPVDRVGLRNASPTSMKTWATG
jgi:hypothetical protein